MKTHKGLSLRYKILMILTLVPIVTLSAYLALVINVFEQDKIAYVFDSTSNYSRSISSQIKNQLIGVVTSLKPSYKEYITSGAPGVLTQEIFQANKDLLNISFFKFENNNYVLNRHFSQPDFKNTDWPNKTKDLVTWLTETDLRQRVVKNPFNDGSVVLFEKISNESNSLKFIVAIVYKNSNLMNSFNNPSQVRIFLNNDTGDIILGATSQEAQSLNKIFSKNYFNELKKKNGNDGTEIINASNGISYMTSFSKVGYGDLIITSMIDKKNALSAIKILLRKSILFFGFLLMLTILISLISSKKLTQAIQDLLEATQKISKGDFNFKLKIKSKDEVGSLVNSFNIMSQEISRLLKETAEKARMASELQTAKTVQETLFPQPNGDFQKVKIAGHYEPASECGGDWWYYFKSKNKIYFCIGDATGHGAPAALITSAARSASSVIENFDLSAKDYVRLLNKSIYDVSKGKVMMTFFLGVIDIDTLVLTYCNASHEPPYLIKKSSNPPKKKELKILFDVNNPRLGENKDTIFKEATIKLQNGDSIFVYTDGIADVKNKKKEEFGERNLVKSITESLKDYPEPSIVVDRYKKKIQDFREQCPLDDDVTFFMVQCEDRAT